MNYSEVISSIDSMASDDREIFLTGIIDKINTYKQNSSGNVAMDIFNAGENIEDLTVLLLKSFMGKELTESVCATIMGNFDLNSDLIYALFDNEMLRMVNVDGKRRLYVGSTLFCKEGNGTGYSLMSDDFNIDLTPYSVSIKNKSNNDEEIVMIGEDGLVSSRHRVQSFDGATMFGISSIPCKSGIAVSRDSEDPTKIELSVHTTVGEKEVVSSKAEGFILSDGWFDLSSDSKPTKSQRVSSESFEGESIKDTYVGKRFPNLVSSFKNKYEMSEVPKTM